MRICTRLDERQTRTKWIFHCLKVWQESRGGGFSSRGGENLNLAYMELVVFQYMLIVFAQLLTVESRIVCRQTKNTKVTKDVETIVTTWTNEQRAPRHHCSPRIQRSTNNHDKNKNNKQRHLHFSYCRPQPPSTTVARTPHPHFTIFVRIGSRFLFFLFFLSYLFFSYFSHVRDRNSGTRVSSLSSIHSSRNFQLSTNFQRSTNLPTFFARSSGSVCSSGASNRSRNSSNVDSTSGEILWWNGRWCAIGR